MGGGDFKIDTIFIVVIIAIILFHLFNGCLCNNMKTTEGFSKDSSKCESTEKRCPKESSNGLLNGLSNELSICCPNNTDCSYFKGSKTPSCAL